MNNYPLNRDQLRTAVKIGYRRRKHRIPPLLALALHGVAFFIAAAAFMAALVIIAEALLRK